ncbi:MAG TPA: hypothetical protein VGI42_04690 [Chthoniobacterales bacterium]|jgi:uncharacterized membrane protein
MPDPVDPTPPPIISPEPGVKPTTTGLPSNVAAALACIPLIGGIIFYLVEKTDQFVRFYAMQSIIFGAIWVLFDIAYSIAHAIFVPIPVAGAIFAVLLWLIWAFVHLAFFVVMIIAMVKAFSGVRWDIPYVGPIARKQMGEVVL